LELAKIKKSCGTLKVKLEKKRKADLKALKVKMDLKFTKEIKRLN
jgi:hypothetical protein